MWHFNFHFKVSLPLTTSIGIYLLLNLVFTPEYLWTDSLPTWWHMSDRIYRQRLQMPLSTWIQGHQLRGKKRWVKKHFSFGEILLWKTLLNPLSYFSMNPTVSLIKPATRPSAPPDVWIPFCSFCFPIHLPDWAAGCLAVYSFYPIHILLFKINSSHMCGFFYQQ